MLRNAKDLHGLTIRATDGDIGTVDQFYFEDQTWAIRYLTVDTGGWLEGRQVLISPISVLGVPDWEAKRLDVALTKKQVENSPDINTHQPVSRQHEIAYFGYYGYPFYWGGSDLWGAAPNPTGLAIPIPASTEAIADSMANESADSHLRSAEEVRNYYLEAVDGEIGKVDGFIVDDEAWAIRYIEVATRSWWPGKKVLVSPAWAEKVSWEDSKVFVSLTRETIKDAPEYIESTMITREYERQLHAYYGWPPYWPHEAGHESSLPLSGV
jgi:PRC-barrel domain